MFKKTRIKKKIKTNNKGGRDLPVIPDARVILCPGTVLNKGFSQQDKYPGGFDEEKERLKGKARA